MLPPGLPAPTPGKRFTATKKFAWPFTTSFRIQPASSWQENNLECKVQRNIFECLPGFLVRRRWDFRAGHGRECSLAQFRIAFLGRRVHHHAVPQKGNPDGTLLPLIVIGFKKLLCDGLLYLFSIVLSFRKFSLVPFRRHGFLLIAAGAGGQEKWQE